MTTNIDDITFEDLAQRPEDCEIDDFVTALDLENETGYTRQAFHNARKIGRLWAHRFGHEWVFYKPYAVEYVKRMQELGTKKHALRTD